MAAITICSDFGAQENKVPHCNTRVGLDRVILLPLNSLNVWFHRSSVQSLSRVRLFATP